MRRLLIALLVLAGSGCNLLLDIPSLSENDASVPDADDGHPHVDRVRIEGYGDSTQARQGAGSITLTVTGVHLDALDEVRLGDLSTTVEPGATASSLRLTAEIPHGASPGPISLVVSGSAGRATMDAALVITPISVATGGDDAAGLGTPERPLASLRQALRAASAGDTVRLAAGTYGLSPGWPATGVKVPAGVVIEGAGAALTRLDAGQQAGAASDGLVFAADATLKNLGFAHLGDAIVVRAGHVVIDSVTVQDSRSQGLVISGAAHVDLARATFAGGPEQGIIVHDTATLTATDVEVSGYQQQGIAINGHAQVKLLRIDAHTNGESTGDDSDCGVLVSEMATITVEDSRIHNNAVAGMEVNSAQLLTVKNTDVFGNGFVNGSNFASHGLVARGATVIVEGGEYYGNGSDGIQLESGTASVRGVVMRDNGSAGLVLTFMRSVTVRDTQIRGQQGCCGIYVNGSNAGVLDLGSDSEPGHNQITHNIAAIRDARSTPGARATFVGTTINGRGLPAGPVLGPVESSPDYVLEHDTQLEF